MKDFRRLSVWKKAHDLALAIYRMTSKHPKEEQYGLTSQMRRAVVSVPANIAEGCGRRSDVEQSRFLQIAFGSASELEYLVLLSRDLGYVTSTDHQPLNENVLEVKRMLAALIRRMRSGT